MSLKKRIYKILYYLRSYTRLTGRGSEISLVGLLDFFSATRREVSVIQVGANDGVTNDPLHRFFVRDKWHGVLLEPQSEVFYQLLVPAYRDCPRVKLENAALAEAVGTKHLYKIAFSNARWATGLATFEKSSITALIESGYVEECAKKEGVVLPDSAEEYLTAEEIKTVTFPYLFQKYSIQKLDLLAIDTEGYDFEIIKLFDLDKCRPSMILFENMHLSVNHYEACKAYLRSYGYKICHKGPNTIALFKSWHNLLPMLVK